jgi:hypothetical protein
MFEALLICFREGLESFLVVAIMVITLQKARLHWLLPAVRTGENRSALSILGGVARHFCGHCRDMVCVPYAVCGPWHRR